MSGRNIRIPGHALKPTDPLHRYRAECYCGAWSNVIAGISNEGRLKAIRMWHDEHKVAVLRSRGELNWDEES